MGITLDQETLKNLLLKVYNLGNEDENATAKQVITSIRKDLNVYYSQK